MKIDNLIIGGGLAGSLMAWTLQKQGKSIIVVDQFNENSSSRVAAGIINPITGRRLTSTWKAFALLPFADQFYKALEKELQQRFYYPRKIIRLFNTPEEEALWENRKAENEPPLFHKITQTPFPEFLNPACGGIELENGGNLDTVTLLNALREKFKNGGFWREGKTQADDFVENKDSISWQDIEAKRVIFCEGYQAHNNPFFSWLPFKPAKGELLHIRLDSQIPDPIFIRGRCFLVSRPDGICASGATYDWNTIDDTPTQAGRLELETNLKKLTSTPFTVEKHLAGIRPATPDAKPFIGKHPQHPRFILFNGFGSKGVQQIPYFAQHLANHLIQGTPLDADIDLKRFIRPITPRIPFKATRIAQEEVAQQIKKGDLVIDATAGNGYDTLWLAEQVGTSGHVLSIDLQASALDSTRTLLEQTQKLERVELCQGNHSHLDQLIPSTWQHNTAAIMFNLGYLPGGDKTVTTKPETTLKALKNSWGLLKAEGILTVVLYTQHPGGRAEAETVLQWAENMNPEEALFKHIQNPLNLEKSPSVVSIIKR
ncbi:MAG: FAD-dependent oxidoreductase [Opitutaceae bacterium]|nr:FAD-dependent oxidoreductase [Opitutaceae bacterium]